MRPRCIDFSQKEEMLEVNVNTMIIATDFKRSMRGEHRITVMENTNVYTALSGTARQCIGPANGEVVTRDGKHPKVLASFIASVRAMKNAYGVHVCMYSLKLAHLIKEHTGAEVYNFYIDMRTPGKGYEEFYDKL